MALSKLVCGGGFQSTIAILGSLRGDCKLAIALMKRQIEIEKEPQLRYALEGLQVKLRSSDRSQIIFA